MTGFRRRFVEGMLRPQFLGWWGLVLLAIGGCCGVWAADSPAMEPSAAPSVARGEEGGHCYRPLSDVIWGFLVTLLTLAVSLWGSVKHRSDGAADACMTILAAVLAPFADLIRTFEMSLWCVSLLWNCHKMEYPNSRITSYSWLTFLCSSLFPWSKSPARILANCDIVVYVSTESPLLEKGWLWSFIDYVEDESEALVVGENGARRLRDHQYVRRQLSEAGVALLVWKEVFCKAEDSKRLPKYGELKYLRGNSGFAVIAIALQAFGYIYAGGFRMAKNLRISPLEVIGLIFNIIFLIRVFLYGAYSRCHRPLVIYMDGEWEHDFGEFDNNNQKKFEYYDSRKVQGVIFYGIFFGFSILLTHCGVNLVKATNLVVVVPIILFLLGLWLGFLGYIAMANDFDIGIYMAFLGCIANAMAYIWAMVGTIIYWKTMHFNTQANLVNLSQIIPFIG